MLAKLRHQPPPPPKLSLKIKQIALSLSTAPSLHRKMNKHAI